MKYKIWLVLCAAVLLVGALLPNGVQPVLAQAPEPPQKEVFIPQDCPPEGPCQDENGDWYIPEGARPPQEAPTAPAATGGPDDFGYTWDDSVPYNWMDVTNGTDLGFSGFVDSLSNAIPLPFNFKYYENIYTQVYVSPAGYLTFTYDDVVSSSQIPYSGQPNNVIAPYWTPAYYSTTGTTGRAYYKTGGIAPNRYFAAEWNQIFYADEKYTFEVLLYENGNILFQYQQMQYSGSHICGSGGIEDTEGLDGLKYLNYCQQAPSTKAVLFTRPGASIRIKVNPLYQGGFTHSGETDTFNFKVTNTGELGNDTYDFTVASPWPVTFYGTDSTTPLGDSDGDTHVDTGSIPQGASCQVYARVDAPVGLALGDENTAYITVSSSLNPSKVKVVRIDSTIPAPFTQAYVDANDDGRMSLDQNWPAVQLTRTAANEGGVRPVVVETPSHNIVYVWSESSSTDTWEGTTLHYALLDKSGKIIRPASSLTQPDPSTSSSGDYEPILAAAPDGKVGIAWYRAASKYENNQWLYNYNMWFALLNPDGSLAYGPANLTNYAWLPSGEGFTHTYDPAIAASGDNRFMVAWRQMLELSDSYLVEVYTAIIASSGVVVAAPDKIAEGVPGSRSYGYPSVTALNGARFLLAYNYSNSNPYKHGVMYRVYDSARALLKPETESGLDGYMKYGAQLSGGNVLLAVNDYGEEVTYTILDGLTLNPLGSFNPLSHPSALTGSRNLSVTADSADHGIITWQDQGLYIYYALVDANGVLLSGPAISRAAKTGSNAPYLQTGSAGASTTTNSWVPQEGVDTLLELSPLYGAAPGGTAVIGMYYANNGFTTADNPQIAVTLPAGLTYLGALPNSCTLGATLTCNLPDLAFGDSGRLQIYLGLPPAVPIGTTYALQAAINSAGETYPADNDADTEVFAGLQVFLPSIQR